MKTSFFSLLLLSCLLSLPIISHCDQALQLQRFIHSQELSASPRYGSDQLPPPTQACIIPQDGSKDADKITELPGQPEGVDFHQYAGYVTVDQQAGRSLFYYFVESPQCALEKPLLLWLTGGPGCSSLGVGAMAEIGPFRVNNDNKTLSRNMFAWSNVANVIFLESPTGVGFSYSKNISDYSLNGDNRTAEDSYTFLINWLERFPEYKNRDFFIAGESYAGHYVPQLASTILQHNKESGRTVINLRGIAIGNAYIDFIANTRGQYEFYYNHALISEETYTSLRKACGTGTTITMDCFTALGQLGKDYGSINAYNIYAPACLPTNNPPWTGGIEMASYDPCSYFYIQSYINLPEVQKALHARPGLWETCTGLYWIDRPLSVHSTIKEVIASGIDVWLYSGAIDGSVPTAATKLSIKALELPVKKPWRPWYYSKEVGGHVEEYEGLTFATVRAAGHTVPSYQPERALTLISSFLKGESPPSE